MEEIFYPSSDGKNTVHACIWRPVGNVAGVVQIVHGMAEYAARYAPFAEYLCSKGFVVCAEDHLGHGKTAAEKEDLGYFCGGDGSELVLSDIRALNRRICAEYPDVPCIMLGHSMGSFFCRTYISRYGGELAGAVIMGTGFQPAAVTAFGKAVVRCIALFCGWRHRSRLVNALAFGSYNKKCAGDTPFDWLSADKGNVQRYVADPLCGVTFTCSGFLTLFSILGKACSVKAVRGVPRDLPLVLVAGADDPVGGYGGGVKKLYNKFLAAGATDAEVILYEGCRHEILNDVCAEKVYSDILSFLTDICG